MFETAGSLAIVEPALALFGLIALPLLWAIVAALAAPRQRTGSSGLVTTVALLASLATLGLASILSVRLAFLPARHVLFQHVAQLARLGQLDLTMDLALDARGCTFAILIALVAVAAVVQSLSVTAQRSARLAWTATLTTGAMLVCLGDGVPPILIGLGVLALGAWGLSRGSEPRASAAAFGGNLAVLLGFIFLFWSLGGAFGSEGYDPDGAPRFVLVTTSAPARVPEQATLSMTSYAGALVSADDADLPGEPLVSPLSIAVPPGTYTLRIQRGAASGDVVVPRVALVAGKTHVLTPYGPTTSLRSLDDQLATPRMVPTGQTANVRAVLAGRTVGGLRASAVVLLLVLGGALGHVYSMASRRHSSGSSVVSAANGGSTCIATVLEAAPAPYLALRLAPLVDPLGADGWLVILLGAGSGFVLAARAAQAEDPDEAIRGVLAATVAVAVAAAGLGEPSSLIIIVASAVIAASAALAAIDVGSDVRWLGVSCAALIGLFPGAGTSVGFILAITAALGSAATGSVVWAVLAGVLALVLAGTCALVSLAAFRAHAALDATPRRVSSLQESLVVVLAIVALAVGVVLGAGTSMFGGHVTPFVHRLAGPTTIASTRAMAGAAVILTLVATISGLVLSRRPKTEGSSWLGRPQTVFASTASGIGDVAHFLERSVRAMDRDVIELVPSVIGSAVQRAAGAFAKPSENSTSDEPNRAPNATAIVLVMVALLGSIVLSSFLLS